VKKVKIINFLINPITMNQLINKIKLWRNFKNKSHYICISSVHGCIESYFDKNFKKAHNAADIAVPDGRPIYWALRILGSNKAQHLPGYLVTKKICELANERNFKIGLYGSTLKNQNFFIKSIKRKYNKIDFSYKYSPPFRKLSKLEKKKIQKSINKSNIDILFVVLGAPKQDMWMHENKNKLKCVMVGIGAAMDFISGNKILPPKILEYMGLAWLFRLMAEPRRLFWRYFSIIFIFIFLFLLQITGLKKFK